MLLIYCADPLHLRQPDSDYQEEIAAAEALGLAYELISYEALVDDGDARWRWRWRRCGSAHTSAISAHHRHLSRMDDAHGAIYPALRCTGGAWNTPHQRSCSLSPLPLSTRMVSAVRGIHAPVGLAAWRARTANGRDTAVAAALWRTARHFQRFRKVAQARVG